MKVFLKIKKEALFLFLLFFLSCSGVEYASFSFRLFPLEKEEIPFEEIKVMIFDEGENLLETKTFAGGVSGTERIRMQRNHYFFLQVFALLQDKSLLFGETPLLHGNSPDSGDIYLSPISHFSEMNLLKGKDGCSTGNYIYFVDDGTLKRASLINLRVSQSLISLPDGFTMSCSEDSLFYSRGREICVWKDSSSAPLCTHSSPVDLRYSGSAVWGGIFLQCGGINPENLKFERCLYVKDMNVNVIMKDVPYYLPRPFLLPSHEGIYIFTGSKDLYFFDGEDIKEIPSLLPAHLSISGDMVRGIPLIYISTHEGSYAGYLSTERGFSSFPYSLSSISLPRSISCNDELIVGGDGIFMRVGENGFKVHPASGSVNFAARISLRSVILGADNSAYLVNCGEVSNEGKD